VFVVCISSKPLTSPTKSTMVANPERHTMSTVSIRIDASLADAARVAAIAELRTVQGQVEFWAKVGRAALDNPDLPAAFIAESLVSQAEARKDNTPFTPRSRAHHQQG
jgi:hypothetical protein